MHWRLLNRIIFPGFVLILFFGHSASCQKRLVDKTKSRVDFEVTHLGMLTVSGSFHEFEGIIEVKDKQAIVSGRIKSASMVTGNAERDAMVKGKAYLNVDAYPEISFSATGTVLGDSLSIAGPMKLRGVSRTAKLKCKYVSDQQLECTMFIKRSDFKLDFGSMDALVGDDVSVKLNLFLLPAR